MSRISIAVSISRRCSRVRRAGVGCIAISLLTILGLKIAISIVHGIAGETCVVAVSSSDGCASSSHLGIPSVVCLLVTLPEWTTTNTGGVVVAWAWAVALLLLVVAGEQDLEDGGDEEQEDVDNSNSEDGGLELACLAQVGRVCDVLA